MSRSALIHDPRQPYNLDALVKHMDTAFDDADQNYLIRVSGDSPDFAVMGLRGQHPLDDLLGFRAPPDWAALGLHCAGRAHRVDDGFDISSGGYPLAEPDGGRPPVDVHFTLVIDRLGRGAGLMRGATTTTTLKGAPEGLLGDACLRALGLPTTSPPPSTAELWLRLWLDRLVESVTFDNRGCPRHRSFAELAALHPAALGTTAVLLPGAPLDTFLPEDLAEATHLVAAEWPWSRLRADPAVVEGEGPPLGRSLAAWMDDGMFARWLLADTPPLPLLLKTAAELLPHPVLHDVEETVLTTGLR